MFLRTARAEVHLASYAAWRLGVYFAAILLAGLVLFSGQVVAQTASISAITGQSCAGTRFGSNLNCTANDFSSALSFDQPSGNAIANCVAGSTISINVIAAITSNSPQRYDGAYFLGENGISPELNSTSSSCSLGVFPATPSPFQNQDSDVCGDYASGGVSTLEITNAVVKCSPVPGTNQLALPYVLVFNNNTGGSSCTTANITANTKSKCISSTTATVTGVTVNGFVTITKQTLPDTQPGSFAFSGSASPTATVTPASGNLVDNGAQTFEVPLNAGGTRTLTISETALAGWDTTAAITCTTPSGGSAAAYVTVDNATRTITASLTETNFGALCTVTNTKRPTVKLQKITEGDFGGPFAFSATNLDTAIADISTTAANSAAPASTTAHLATAIGTSVAITETVHSDYVFNTGICVDANSARTGNVGAIGTLAGSTLTIPAANMTAGADYTCTFTNGKKPTLQIRSVSNGALGTFGFSGDNGYAGDSIATTVIGGATAGVDDQLNAPTTATAITATMPFAFAIVSASCTGLGAGGTASLSGAVLTLDAAALAPGVAAICTYVFERRPIFSVQKITTGTFGGPFAFSTVNLTGSIADISTSVVGAATPASPSDFVASTTGSAVQISESFGLAFVVTGISCSDANSAVTGAVNPVATSTTASVTVPATAVVVGADITCVFTNAQAVPQLSLSKSASVGSVTAAGQNIVYSMVVTNAGNTVLTSVVVSDPLGTVVCPTSGTAIISTLAVGGIETCTLTYVAPQSAFDTNGGGDGDIDNTASADTTYNGAAVGGQDSAAVNVVVTPNLALTKQATSAGPFGAGDIVTYRFRATNSGNVTLTAIYVADISNGNGSAVVPAGEVMAVADDVSPTGDSSDATNNGTWDVLAPGDTVEFTGTYMVVQEDVDWLW